MILHTILPFAAVFPQEGPSPVSEGVFGGKKCLYEVRNGKTYLNRILSTDPSDYLDPGCCPGTEITIDSKEK